MVTIRSPAAVGSGGESCCSRCCVTARLCARAAPGPTRRGERVRDRLPHRRAAVVDQAARMAGAPPRRRRHDGARAVVVAGAALEQLRSGEPPQRIAGQQRRMPDGGDHRVRSRYVGVARPTAAITDGAPKQPRGPLTRETSAAPRGRARASIATSVQVRERGRRRFAPPADLEVRATGLRTWRCARAGALPWRSRRRRRGRVVICVGRVQGRR